jgi:hypothetical protein
MPTKSIYERVSDAVHGVDDTLRDTFVYPSNRAVLGISETEDSLVLSFASEHDDGVSTQQIRINTDNIDALLALQESISRILGRVEQPKEGPGR